MAWPANVLAQSSVPVGLYLATNVSCVLFEVKVPELEVGLSEMVPRNEPVM